ncbi:MAG TPA: hypothetical protein DIW31_04645 [Bacteroidales bacterium]|nr:hypothetical protein [Bacteroidales bacterium]
MNAFSQKINYPKDNSEIQQYQQKTVKIKGIEIQLSEIPLYSSYKIPTSKLKSNPNNESGYDEQWVYSSENKKHFVLVTHQLTKVNYETSKKTDPLEERGIIEMYNEKGELLWSTSKKESIPNYISISDDGSYTHIIWYGSSEETEGRQKLFSYDKSGKEVFYIDNIGYIIPNELNTAIYYRIRVNPSKNDLTNTLYFYDFHDKKQWEKTFDKSNNVFSYISGNGNFVLVRDGSSVYLVDSNGKTLWEHEFSPAGGKFAMSYDGTFLLRIVKPYMFEIYNSSSLKLIFKKEQDQNTETEPWVLEGCFVNNSTIAILTNTAPNKCMINFYDLNGKLLNCSPIKCGSSTLSIKEVSYDTFDVYTDGIKRIEYKIK